MNDLLAGRWTRLGGAAFEKRHRPVPDAYLADGPGVPCCETPFWNRGPGCLPPYGCASAVLYPSAPPERHLFHGSVRGCLYLRAPSGDPNGLSPARRDPCLDQHGLSASRNGSRMLSARFWPLSRASAYSSAMFQPSACVSWCDYPAMSSPDATVSGKSSARSLHGLYGSSSCHARPSPHGTAFGRFSVTPSTTATGAPPSPSACSSFGSACSSWQRWICSSALRVMSSPCPFGLAFADAIAPRHPVPPRPC